jgi:hypothetical protein
MVIPGGALIWYPILAPSGTPLENHANRALPAAATPRESGGGDVFPWLNASVSAPAPQDGAGPDQAGHTVPAVYAVSRPQPFEGLITIVLGNSCAARAAAGAALTPAANAATTKSASLVTRLRIVDCSSMADIS